MTNSREVGFSSPTPSRGPTFSTRTAQEDISRLNPSDEPDGCVEARPETPTRQSSRSYEPPHPPSESYQSPRAHLSFPTSLFGNIARWRGSSRELGRHGQDHHEGAREDIATPADVIRDSELDKKGKHGLTIRLSANGNKLGTFSGVFVPTTLNVLSILMFLRFGFVLGQSGFLGMMGLLIVSYTINLVTTMSLSAIATNGTVKGGGAYYLISRSLGPEFGGSIGMVFYMGYVFNTGMNAVGLVDCFMQNFGVQSGTSSNFLEEGFWWQYLWATIVLIVCTGICLAGSSIFARASNGLLVVLLVATFSIPFSAIFVRPFSIPQLNVEFTGVRLRTFLGNLKPRFTKTAAGSQIRGRETFQDLFGILFPATGGIFAGASMSGDLRNPSKSIPKGTLAGLALTFLTYTLIILAMAASITRESLYKNLNVIQITNISGIVVLLGEFASAFFSTLMGVIGSAKLLQAIARDRLIPGLGLFSKGTEKYDEPIHAIILTYIVAQCIILFDINRIASFVTMTYLMTFLVTNLACFLLKIGSAPNFRPSFHYFNWQTAAAGTILSGASMFFVDVLSATGCVGMLIALFLLIHYTSPPKAWGDVSQSLIYHQVRKYLLRLRPEHVKFWRPQILLFVDDIERQYKMVSFCNSLKKGALFVLGKVIVTEDFSVAVPEARRKQVAWQRYIEHCKVKAFVNITVSPAAEWGVRNLVLNSGLGGMRPNIAVIDQFRRDHPLFGSKSRRDSKARRLSSYSHNVDDAAEDADAQTPSMNSQSYVTILEDLLFKLRINVAVAKGFEDLELPEPKGMNTKKYIDLWPIQMSAEFGADSERKQNLLTTNFDTYTLILQLGCILHTVPSWKKSYKLRVAVFVEYETDVNEERGRVEALLDKLRIEAEVLVFALACGDLKVYEIIVNGDTSSSNADSLHLVNIVLENDSWWQDIRSHRDEAQSLRDLDRKGSDNLRSVLSNSQSISNQTGAPKPTRSLSKLMQSRGRRRSVSSINNLGGVNLGMQTHRLLDAFVDYDAIEATSEESSSSSESEFEPYDDDESSDEDSGLTDFDRSTAARSTSALQKQPVHTASPTPSPTNQAPDPPVLSITAADEEASPKSLPAQSRPSIHRSPSGNRFSSSPIPVAKVNTDDSVGPSIMFAPSTSPPRFFNKLESIYRRRSSFPGSPATGYPNQAALPISFNNLPSRAQHLILNELMVKQSSETAVVFTTLPSPLESTSQSDEASDSYLSDLEVLWMGLPPCLLVHSNSMTVTMNL